MARWRFSFSPERFQHWPTRLAAWALAILAVYQLVRFGGQVVQSQQIDERIMEQQTTIAALELDQEQLKGERDYALSDAAVERLAREQLDMVYPEDRVLHIVTVVPEITASPPPSPVVIPPTPTPAPANWRGWWEAVFGD